MIRQHPFSVFFVLAYGISWLLWAPLWLPALGVQGLPTLPFPHALGAIGPLAAAFIVSHAEQGEAGTRDLLQRMGLWRGQLRWVLVALLAPLGVLVLALLGAALLGGETLVLTELPRYREFPSFSALGFLLYNIVSFGYGEEVGWRGFALPRLQSRYSPRIATGLLTVGWALWHLPLFLYRPGYTSMDVAGIVAWLFSLATGAILLTWLYNKSRGSILVVALFHAAIDVVFTLDIASQVVVNITGGLITAWGLVVFVILDRQPVERVQA